MGTDLVGDRWQWIIDLIFSGVIFLGFQTLEETLRTGKGSSAARVGQIYCAFCVFAFVLYEAAAYHLFTNKFPYLLTLPSALRYVIDIPKAFLLCVVLLTACRSTANQKARFMVVLISVWHLAGLLWHVLGYLDYASKGYSLVDRATYHLGAIAFYWIVYGAARWWSGTARVSEEGKGWVQVVSVSTAMLIVAIYRTVQILTDRA